MGEPLFPHPPVAGVLKYMLLFHGKVEYLVLISEKNSDVDKATHQQKYCTSVEDIFESEYLH
jgi:hypothetical protein